MESGKVRHLFPGGNTANGFFSYYSNIMTGEEANRFIIIKGGPGTGKSTFMKKIAKEMLDKGYDVEYLHCSSDNNSLDGIKVPKLKVAIIDGTKPHVVDPITPGAVDEILNFGEFWDDKGIRTHKDDIIKTSQKISHVFLRAYQYLKAADALYEDTYSIYTMALKKGKLYKESKNLTNTIFGDKEYSDNTGRDRKLFASAMTPNGLCNYLDSLLTVDTVYEIKGNMGSHEAILLEEIKSEAMKRGLFAEAFYCALRPHKLQHLIIPSLNVAITTSNDYHTSTVTKSHSIDINDFYSKEIINEYQDNIDENKKEFNHLLQIALSTISKAKVLHDELEGYYIPYVNFKKIDECFEKVISKFLDE